MSAFSKSKTRRQVLINQIMTSDTLKTALRTHILPGKWESRGQVSSQRLRNLKDVGGTEGAFIENMNGIIFPCSLQAVLDNDQS